jgi:hypothetical protein
MAEEADGASRQRDVIFPDVKRKEATCRLPTEPATGADYRPACDPSGPIPRTREAPELFVARLL